MQRQLGVGEACDRLALRRRLVGIERPSYWQSLTFVCRSTAIQIVWGYVEAMKWLQSFVILSKEDKETRT